MSNTSATKTRILDGALEALRENLDGVSMGRVAELAGISRQAVYLYFANKKELLVAAARHIDNRHGLERRLAPLGQAKTAEALLAGFAAFLAGYNPLIYPVVRAADSVRKRDADVERAWRDRLENRRRGCQKLVKRLSQWGRLAPEWTVPTARDWMTAQASVKLWEELVIDLGWSSARYQRTMLLSFTRALIHRNS